MSEENKSGLDSGKFKNIGIDTSFIEENANEYNDKIKNLYTGGKEQGQPETLSQAVVQPQVAVEQEAPIRQQTEAPVVMAEPQTQMEQPQEQDAQPQQVTIPTEQIEQIVDAKVLALAEKMQAYANETDAKIAALEAKLVDVQKQQPPQQKLVVEKQTSAEPKHTSNHDALPEEADVSIEKIFDFSNKR